MTRSTDPEIPSSNRIEYVLFTEREAVGEREYRNGNVIHPGRIDRSPCGTGIPRLHPTSFSSPSWPELWLLPHTPPSGDKFDYDR